MIVGFNVRCARFKREACHIVNLMSASSLLVKKHLSDKISSLQTNWRLHRKSNLSAQQMKQIHCCLGSTREASLRHCVCLPHPHIQPLWEGILLTTARNRVCPTECNGYTVLGWHYKCWVRFDEFILLCPLQYNLICSTADAQHRVPGGRWIALHQNDPVFR